MKNKVLSLSLVLFVLLSSVNVFAAEKNVEKLSGDEVLEFFASDGDSEKEILMNMAYQLGYFTLIEYDDEHQLMLYDSDYNRAYKIRKSGDKFLTFWDDKEGISSFMKQGADTKTGRAYGFVDASGKVVIEPKWELADKFFGGVANVGMFTDSGENYKAMSLINKNGELLTDKTYANIDRFMIPDTYEASLGDRHFFRIFGSKFLNEYEPVDYAYFMEKAAMRRDVKSKFSLANAVVFGGKMGLMDKSGKEIFPPTYDLIQVGDNELISVELDYKFGYINPKGEVVLPLQYDFTSRFRDGVATIVHNDEMAFIDEDLNIIQDFEKAPKWKTIFGVGDIDGLKAVFYKGGKYHDLSSWARSDIYLANSIGIVKESLQEKYKKNITREEFCEMMMAMIAENTRKNIFGKVATDYYDIQYDLFDKAFEKAMKIETSGAYTFTDAMNPAVEMAYDMGIVNGTSPTTFSPNAEITRQEAAVMLMRALSMCKGEALVKENFDLSNTYNDAGEIADWARVYVAKANEEEIMKGVGGNRFAPKDNYTVEQSIVTIIRLYMEI